MHTHIHILYLSVLLNKSTLRGRVNYAYLWVFLKDFSNLSLAASVMYCLAYSDTKVFSLSTDSFAESTIVSKQKEEVGDLYMWIITDNCFFLIHFKELAVKRQTRKVQLNVVWIESYMTYKQLIDSLTS